MFGWAVPNELVHEFKPAWIDDDGVGLEKYDYVCASWEDLDGRPYAAIDDNLLEEAYAGLLCAGHQVSSATIEPILQSL